MVINYKHTLFILLEETPPPAYGEAVSNIGSPAGASLSTYSGGIATDYVGTIDYVSCLLLIVGSPIMSPTSMGPLSVPSSVPSPDVYHGLSPCKLLEEYRALRGVEPGRASS